MITEYIRAGYPLLWLSTLEYERAIDQLLRDASEVDFGLYLWDVVNGAASADRSPVAGAPKDPLGVVKWSYSQMAPKTVLALMNFHRFLNSVEVVQAIINGVQALRTSGRVVVVVSPLGGEGIPVELQRLFTVVEHPLPTVDELEDVLDGISLPDSIEPPTGAFRRSVLEASVGLTAFEAENAFSLGLVRRGRFDAETIFEAKAQMVKKTAALSIGRFAERFDDIGGLERLKRFSLATATDPRARGVMLLGVPGVGKSMFAKALGRELGLPTVLLDMGAVFGSLVGESERKIREALRVVDAMGRCVLFIDEIEKGLAGLEGSGRTDSGVAARVFGTFLTWLADRRDGGAYVVATCNAIEKLPPEFVRAERWDAVFFVDLPNSSERQAILEKYCSLYDVEQEPCPDLTGWTGAEIRSLCRIASMMRVPLIEAAGYVTPIMASAGDRIEALRQWARGRCIPASDPEEAGAKRHLWGVR